MEVGFKIARKKFTFPVPERRVEKEVEVRTCFWSSTYEKRKVTEWVEVKMNFDEFLAEVKLFIDSLGPNRLVNIVENISSSEFMGDEGRTNIMVWYWESVNENGG
jgi:hypothetical protein